VPACWWHAQFSPPLVQTSFTGWTRIGLEVINRQGEALGTVRDWLSTGPQTVLVLDYEEDGSTESG